jgi:hypothetical protein
MGADSMGSGGNNAFDMLNPKIYHLGNALIGCSGPLRLIQWVGCTLVLPERGDKSLFDYMVIDFIEALKETMKKGDLTGSDHHILVAIEGRIFLIDYAFGIAEVREDYQAIGCGSKYAKGALFATDEKLDPKRRVLLALNAAAKYSDGVNGPFIIETLNKSEKDK